MLFDKIMSADLTNSKRTNYWYRTTIYLEATSKIFQLATASVSLNHPRWLQRRHACQHSDFSCNVLLFLMRFQH